MKTIVILGGGYAGLSLARNLSAQARKAANWMLVSELDLHYKTAALHKLAASESEDVTKPISAIIPSDVKFVKAKVSKIEPDKLITTDGEIAYDELIIAAGASSNPFDITGLEDALEIGDYTHAKATKEALDALPDGAKVAILGAGFSGCELAGSLANTKNFKIDIVEAMPEILPMYPNDLAKIGRSKLEAMGINVLSGHRIRALEKNTLVCTVGEEQKRTEYDAVIFTAGVRGSELLEDCFIPARGRRVAVDAQMRVENIPNVRIIGDCAAFFGGNERPYPPTAQIACQMGAYLGRYYSARAAAGAIEDPTYSNGVDFSYSDKGSVCSLGEHDAVGFVKGKRLQGLIATWLKRFIDFKWDWAIR